MTRCGTCDARVIWTVTATGKKMPVNADPVATGNVQLSDGTDAKGRPVKLAHVLGKDEPRVGPLYVSHHSTCPQAAQHRRR